MKRVIDLEKGKDFTIALSGAEETPAGIPDCAMGIYRLIERTIIAFTNIVENIQIEVSICTEHMKNTKKKQRLEELADEIVDWQREIERLIGYEMV